MDNQNDISGQENGKKNYLKKAIISLVLILILVAIATFFDFLGKISKPSGVATLSWKANTELDLSGYRIYYGLSPRNNDCPPGGYANKVDVGNTTSYSITNLNNGTTYYFSLTSYDASGNESCFSKEISKVIPKAKISWYRDINRFFQGIFSPLKVFFQKIF